MQLTNITDQPLPIHYYLPFPLDGALFLPPPEGLPRVLLGQPPGPLPLPAPWFPPLPPRLPPERLPLDFAIVITSFL